MSDGQPLMRDGNHSDGVSLRELVDVLALQRLLESFSNLTGIAAALLTLEGEILAASGWKQICTVFHRAHPDTAARCLESDTVLAGKLKPGMAYNLYRCRNGLVDVAIPVHVDNRAIGNVFIGQFLLEAPNPSQFARQADEFGFDKDGYFAALREVQVLSLERVEAAIALVSNLTQLLGEAGLERKRQLELRAELERRVHQRTAELRDEGERLRALSEASLEGIVLSENGVILDANERAALLLGFERPAELVGLRLTNFVVPEQRGDVARKIAEDYERPYEVVAFTRDGRKVSIEVRGRSFLYQGRKVRGSALRDLTEQRAAQQEVRVLQSILPICSFCKRIRDDQGTWEQVETYLHRHQDTDFSHGICPDCLKTHYPNERDSVASKEGT